MVLLAAASSPRSARLPMASRRQGGARPDGAGAKLHGEWRGEGPCDGGITIRADGTYERGTTRRWTAPRRHLGGAVGRPAAATLVLTCMASDHADFVGKTHEWKLIRLDDEAFSTQYEKQSPAHYTRVKK